MTLRFFAILAIALLLAADCSAGKAAYGQKCKRDSDCETSQLRCHQAKCKNKKLFPMHGSEVGGMVIMVFLSMFSTIAGIGGGPVIVPILLIFFNMSQKETIALSNGLIIFNGVSKLIVSMNSRDPDVPRRALINYDVMYIVNALLLLSSAIGGIITEMLAEIVPIVTFLVLATYALYEAIKKTVSLCKKERAALRKAQEVTRASKESDPQSGTQSNDPSLPADPAGLEIPGQSKASNSTGSKLLAMAIPTSENAPSDEKAASISPNEIGGQLMTDRKADPPADDASPLNEAKPALEPNQPLPSEPSRCLDLLARDKIVAQEGNNFHWLNLLIIIGIFVVANLVTLFRGGSGIKSIIGITKCSGNDWAVFIIYILISLLVSFLGSVYVLKKQRAKQALQLTHPADVIWGTGRLVFGWCFMLVAGAAASISGLGGGSIMTPFMYSIELMPQSASATSLLLTTLSKIVVTLLNYFSGVLLVDYMFFLGAFLGVSSFLADFTNQRIQKKIKKPSIVSFIFAAVMVVCVGLFIGSSVKNINKAKQSGRSITQFGKYCK